MKRCDWCENTEIEMEYHDNEWGVPVHDDDLLFEYLILDAFQAGLNWLTILKKRENFREAFDNFDANKIANYNSRKVEELLKNAGIIRNRSKIESTITNAQNFLKIQDEYASFDKFIWQFTGGKTIVNNWNKMSDVPAKTEEAEQMSKALKKEGFKFVGPTICYAFMQAAGIVNDHLVTCFRYDEVNEMVNK